MHLQRLVQWRGRLRRLAHQLHGRRHDLRCPAQLQRHVELFGELSERGDALRRRGFVHTHGPLQRRRRLRRHGNLMRERSVHGAQLQWDVELRDYLRRPRHRLRRRQPVHLRRCLQRCGVVLGDGDHLQQQHLHEPHVQWDVELYDRVRAIRNRVWDVRQRVRSARMRWGWQLSEHELVRV